MQRGLIALCKLLVAISLIPDGRTDGLTTVSPTHDQPIVVHPPPPPFSFPPLLLSFLSSSHLLPSFHCSFGAACVELARGARAVFVAGLVAPLVCLSVCLIPGEVTRFSLTLWSTTAGQRDSAVGRTDGGPSFHQSFLPSSLPSSAYYSCGQCSRARRGKSGQMQFRPHRRAAPP